jgi:hypothetical protein
MTEPSITNRELTGHPEVPRNDEGLFEMRNRAMLFRPGLLAMALGILGSGVLMMPASGLAQTSCPPTINACGCTIVKAGSYKLGLAIDSSQGLTPAGACIEIASSFVILDGGKKNITGPGGTTPSGIGVWVHRPFRSDFVEFRGSVVSGWDVGVLVQSSQSVIDDVTANSNGTAGVELASASDIELTNTTAETNLNYGIWLKQTSTSDVTNSKTESNGNIGLYVGCSDLGPIGSGCPGVGPSPFNYIFTGNIQGNTNYGVALDLGAKNTIVTNQTETTAGSNSKDDLYDANSSCGSNKWFGNFTGATNNQPGGCIK